MHKLPAPAPTAASSSLRCCPIQWGAIIMGRKRGEEEGGRGGGGGKAGRAIIISIFGI